MELHSAAPAQAAEPNVDIVQGEGLRWINIERPTELEWTWLQEHFDFHALDLEDVPDHVRSLLGDRPRLEQMAAAMRRAARPNAAKEIAEGLIELAPA